MLSIYRLNLFPKSKVIFLAPTKPLVEQHKEVFLKHTTIPEEQMVVFTGSIKPEKRQELWKNSRIIFSTPQTLSNDIINNRISLKDVVLIVFDESQHATGDYDYVFIAKQYMKTADYPRILGLTASPGSDQEKIQEVCDNLFIENVEIKSKEDADVKPYIKEIKIEWVNVELPIEIKKIKRNLDESLNNKIKKLENIYGKINKRKFLTKKDILELQSELRGKISDGEKNPDIWIGISIVSELIKIHHALELIETQSISSLYLYMKKF